MAVIFTIPQPSGDTRTLILDCVPRRTHRAAATITENNVEQGVNTSDHIRPEPATLELGDVIISNQPHRIIPDDFSGEVEGDTQGVKLATGVNANVFQLDGEQNRPEEVYAELRRIHGDAVLISVDTPFSSLDDMAIKDLVLSRVPGGGMAWTGDITLKQLRVVQSQEADAPVPRRPRGNRRANNGDQDAENANNTDDGGTSIARRILSSDFVESIF